MADTKITDLSELTSVDKADKLEIADASSPTAEVYATIENILKALNTLTAETSIDNSDEVLLYDASASAIRKMTRANLFAGYALSSHNHDASYQPLDADLSALAALASTGILARTAADTFALRTITGTSEEIAVSNGNGVSGNPTVSLPAGINLSGKTYLKLPTGSSVTVDEAGKIAVDTNTDNSIITHGSIIFHDGSSMRYVVSVDTLPASDGDVLTYVASNNAFEFVAPSGGGGGANTALSNLASVAINTSLISDTDNTDDLGSASLRWKDVFAVTLKSATLQSTGTTSFNNNGASTTFTIDHAGGVYSTFYNFQAGILTLQGKVQAKSGFGTLSGDSRLETLAASDSEIAFVANSAASPTVDVAQFRVDGTKKIAINKRGNLVAAQYTPSSSSDTGETGEIAADANYVYVCTTTNTWKRAALSTF